MKKTPIAILIMLLLFTLSCQKSTAYTHPLTINDITFYVEIADTPESQRMGLMHRTKMQPLEGMLFVYPKEQLLSFWMENTLIPLSIAYIDATGIIREIHDMQPQDRTSIPSRQPVKYALELNQGQFAILNIAVGDKVYGLP
jgi:uncharacterized membrane protein (UPF0127 family)